jgi:glycosyltransferase involved in cell wall biosynthesis
VRLVAVTRPRCLRELEGLPGVEARAEVADDELRELYRRASALLLPLRDAVANNSILEAIACGLPVVTTDVGAVREYLEGSLSAIVPPGRPDLLAEAAWRFLDDPLERSRASAAARRCAVERFDVRTIAARTLRILEEVAAEERGEARPCFG